MRLSSRPYNRLRFDWRKAILLRFHFYDSRLLGHCRPDQPVSNNVSGTNDFSAIRRGFHPRVATAVGRPGSIICADIRIAGFGITKPSPVRTLSLSPVQSLRFVSDVVGKCVQIRPIAEETTKGSIDRIRHMIGSSRTDTSRKPAPSARTPNRGRCGNSAAPACSRPAARNKPNASSLERSAHTVNRPGPFPSLWAQPKTRLQRRFLSGESRD